MSNVIKPSECIYPACGPTCRRDCPPAPANIEPTEEQRAAAIRLWSRAGPTGYGMAAAVDEIARLLAEREAKLREEVTRLEALCTEEARLIVERDTLRARVAELEATTNRAWVRIAAAESAASNYEEMLEEAQKREAQHLAAIKALRAPSRLPFDYGVQAAAYDKAIAATAHYDDAKADAGAVCTHSARVWNVIDQTMRCRVCDGAKAAEGGAR